MLDSTADSQTEYLETEGNEHAAEPIPETTSPAPEAAPQEAEPTPPASEAAEPTPPGPSFTQQLRSALAPVVQKLGPVFQSYGLYILIGLLVLAALFLPPISLLERLGILGYQTLDAAHSVSHPDGITLSVEPSFTGRLRARLDAIPQVDFLSGYAGSAMRQAIEPSVLPAHLEVKSPLYRIHVRGRSDQPVLIDVVIPNASEPWETLDLYTWTGESWEWVGSELHTEVAEHEFLRARVTDVPDNIVVMQAGQIMPTVSTYVNEGQDPAVATGLVTEIHPIGLMLSADGAIVGEPVVQPSASAPYAVTPVLRNWVAGEPIVRGPTSDVLTLPDIQAAHIANIVQRCQEHGYAGIVLDYRGLTTDDRDAFSAFVGALANAMHEAGLRLTIAVEAPILTADGKWDTGAYDWAALAAADALQVPFPVNPDAYAAGGQAQQLLEWAKAQVPRYRLHMLVSALSIDQASSGVITPISLQQALAPLGQATTLYGVTQVEPGGQVELSLMAPQSFRSIAYNETSGTYRLEYATENGENHVIWLGTAASLAAKLQWAQRYHLGGIAVSDLLDPGNGPGIFETVAGYRSTLAVSARPIEVVWTVASADGAVVEQHASTLTAPDYTWTVGTLTGTYNIRATIEGFDHGGVTIVVASRQAATTPSASPATSGGALDPCLRAAYVADVTIPDNTQLDKGAEFTKTWRLQNVGTCPWPADTVLARLQSETGGPESVIVGAVAPGETVDISVPMAAPNADGVFDGLWALQTGGLEIPGGRVTVLIRAGNPTTVVAAPVSRGSFELGGHVRDLSFPYANQMHYAGMTWAKVQVHYGDDASGVIQAAHARDFKIQLSALGTPGMVIQPGFEQQFANWVAGMAAAGADAIEVWNEPNIDREWQIGYISPQAYTNLLCASYRAIKAANPNTLVISAAPAPTGYFGGCSPNGCDDDLWIAGLYNAGAASCMDYIGAHHNSGATSPSATSGHPADDGRHHHSWYFLPQTQKYYNAFGGTRQLFYTEMGYASQEGVPTFTDCSDYSGPCSSFAWARGTDNSEQAAWLSEAVQLSINTGMVRCIIVWNIDFPRYGYDPQDGYAIIRPGGACPACNALHNVLGTR